MYWNLGLGCGSDSAEKSDLVLQDYRVCHGSDSAEKSDLEQTEVVFSSQSSLILGFLIGSGFAL